MERREVRKKKKKRILITPMVAVALSGCTGEKIGKNVSYETRFVIISQDNLGKVVYDEKTGVEYWMVGFGENSGNLTLLVDKDGDPLIYAGE